jgi:phage terminase large subunit-like protein
MTHIETLSRLWTVLDEPKREVTARRAKWLASARPAQLPPDGGWTNWLVLAGRGFGKTRCSMEDAAWYGVTHSEARIALIAATYADARDTMVEGESGLLGILPRSAIATWNRSLGELILPNATRYKLFAATEPDRLRGPQHHRAYCDELAAWEYPETWDQMKFGLRLGDNPRAIIATTPRPTGLLKRIIDDPATAITRGSTFDNEENLAPSALRQLRDKYEGTRLGRQELFAEILEEVPGALWNRTNLEANRIRPEKAPSMRRIIIAIDPATTSGWDADETGIICAGLGVDGHGYVLEDVSGKFSPIEWARKAIALYAARKADRIVAEVNNGGEMVEHTLRMVDGYVSFKPVHASRGKATRAEPVSALYEQNKVHHVGIFTKLEDQQCAFIPDFDRARAGYSPDRMDALVWALTELMVNGSRYDSSLSWVR